MFVDPHSNHVVLEGTARLHAPHPRRWREGRFGLAFGHGRVTLERLLGGFVWIPWVRAVFHSSPGLGSIGETLARCAPCALGSLRTIRTLLDGAARWVADFIVKVSHQLDRSTGSGFVRIIALIALLMITVAFPTPAPWDSMA